MITLPTSQFALAITPAATSHRIKSARALPNAPIEKVAPEIRRHIEGFLYPCDAAAAGASLAATSSLMRASNWFERSKQKRGDILNRFNHAAFWDSQNAKSTACQAATLATTASVAHCITLMEETSPVIVQGSRAATNFHIAIARQTFAPIFELGFGKIRQLNIVCSAPGLQNCEPRFAELASHSGNTATFSTAWIYDCAPDPRAILSSRINEECQLRSYGVEVITSTGEQYRSIIADVEGYMSQLLNTAAKSQQLANVAMALAETTIDSVAALIEIKSGYKASTLLRGAAKACAVFGVAALTGKSVVPYAVGRTAVFAASQALSFAKRLIVG